MERGTAQLPSESILYNLSSLLEQGGARAGSAHVPKEGARHCGQEGVTDVQIQKIDFPKSQEKVSTNRAN